MGCPKRNLDMGESECAMRVLEITRRAFARNPNAMLGDVVDKCIAALNISRSQGYRLVRMATDVLAIPYDATAHYGRRGNKAADSCMDRRGYRAEAPRA